jgi:hypothetical protein
MDTLRLKKKILQRIEQIDDPQILNSLDILLSSSDENIANFINFAVEKMRNEPSEETEYFNDYIREWVKSM